jgi:hypothetical protein
MLETVDTSQLDIPVSRLNVTAPWNMFFIRLDIRDIQGPSLDGVRSQLIESIILEALETFQRDKSWSKACDFYEGWSK